MVPVYLSKTHFQESANSSTEFRKSCSLKAGKGGLYNEAHLGKWKRSIWTIHSPSETGTSGHAQIFQGLGYIYYDSENASSWVLRLDFLLTKHRKTQQLLVLTDCSTIYSDHELQTTSLSDLGQFHTQSITQSNFTGFSMTLLWISLCNKNQTWINKCLCLV